jgi:hypothetical protein
MAEHSSRKNARTSQKSPKNLMQYFKSARVCGNFLAEPKGQPAHTQAALNERKAEG